MTSAQWGDLIQQFGFPTAALFGVIYGFMSGKLVTRREFDGIVQLYKEERADRIKAQEQATRLSEQQTATVERLSGHGRRGDVPS